MSKQVVDILLEGNRDTPDNPTYITAKMIDDIELLISVSFNRGIFVGIGIGAAFMAVLILGTLFIFIA